MFCCFHALCPDYLMQCLDVINCLRLWPPTLCLFALCFMDWVFAILLLEIAIALLFYVDDVLSLLILAHVVREPLLVLHTPYRCRWIWLDVDDCCWYSMLTLFDLSSFWRYCCLRLRSWSDFVLILFLTCRCCSCLKLCVACPKHVFFLDSIVGAEMHRVSQCVWQAEVNLHQLLQFLGGGSTFCGVCHPLPRTPPLRVGGFAILWHKFASCFA